MKKLYVALALLGLCSTSVLAGGVDYQEPEESGVFIVGAEALYVRPHGSDFLYALQFTTDANNNSIGRSLQVDPDFQFGYHVDIAYAMPGNGPDISLGYTHLCTDDHENKGAVSGNGFSFITSGLGGQSGFQVDGAGAGVVRAKTDYDYIDVDLLLGKEFVLKNRYHFHPFAGVRYADIDSTDRAFYTINSDVVGTGELRNQFDGVGPRAGVDAAMEIAGGFSFIARAAGSVIVGNYDWRYFDNNPVQAADIGTAGTEVFKNSDEHLMVPEADYRIGINYTHEFSADTSCGVELGWNVVNYFDVMDKSASRTASTVGVTSDWGFQGPYLRVQANFA